MPRPRNKEVWEDSIYKNAYCFNRAGRVYLCVDTVRKATKPPLKWCREAKPLALKQLRTMIEKQFSGQEPQQKAWTLYDGIQEFARAEFAGLAKHTRTNYRSTFKLYLSDPERPNYNPPLSDHLGIREVILDNFRRHNHRANGRRQHYNKLKRLFDFCISEQIMQVTPMIASMRPPKEKTEIRTYSPEQIQSLVELSHQNASKFTSHKRHNFKVLALHIRFTSLVGTRMQETLSLTWDNVTESGIVIDGKRSRNGSPKIREFPVDLVPGTRQLLAEIRELPQRYKPQLNRLFPYFGRARDFCWEALKYMSVEIGCPGMNSHNLRKAAENFWEKELHIPLHICAYMAGHTPQVQAEHYTRQPTAEELYNMANNHPQQHPSQREHKLELIKRDNIRRVRQ